METALIECKIKVGRHGVKKPTQAMWNRASRKIKSVASSVIPFIAVCNRCKDEMKSDELKQDLKIISCPNCYSDNIIITMVLFELGYKNYNPNNEQIT